MKIERYTGVTIALVIGVFLMGAILPEASLAQNNNAQNCAQCAAPANTWCVPATSGKTVSGTVCTTYVPPANETQKQAAATPATVQRSDANTWCAAATSGGTVCTTYVPGANAPQAPRVVVRESTTPLDVVGSVLAAPFVLAQCILDGCPTR